MKNIYDKLSNSVSSKVMYEYSTSFYLSTFLLSKEMKQAIYSVYAFVRLADEIVDSFHDYDKEKLLNDFHDEFDQSIENKISLNPIFNSFQSTYHKYNFEYELVESFLNSMRLDLNKQSYDDDTFSNYIYGSAEVVGLMCLKVFVHGDSNKYDKLKPYAISLGAAFQKVNFLRDIDHDVKTLDRDYFNLNSSSKISEENKKEIILNIKNDFKHALIGIKLLDKNVQFGVYTAYLFYQDLLSKIEVVEASELFKKRISVINYKKIILLFKSILNVSLNLKF
tara:strand:+ start:4917 stop:5756 length:840 start_codon:yes stop_codon:yes gene_type:complete